MSHFQTFTEKVAALHFNATEADIHNVVENKATSSAALDLTGIMAFIEAIMTAISGLGFCSQSDDEVIEEVREPRLLNKIIFKRSLKRELDQTPSKGKHSQALAQIQVVVGKSSDVELKEVLQESRKEDYILI